MTGFWAQAPPGRVTRLVGADPAALAQLVTPPPAGAPAVVTCPAPPQSSTGQVIDAALTELEQVACRLYPAWLPGADGLDNAAGARPAAVRALARQHGRASGHFGPFVADLAARAIGARGGRQPRPARAIRAAGLARVIAEGLTRPHTALLMLVTEAVPPPAADALISAGDWLAHHGGLAVWVAGEVDSGERVAAVSVASVSPPPASPASPAPRSPAAGVPHPASDAEQALERALAGRRWAAGRAWNRLWQAHSLAPAIRVDLMWQRERCAVEIDGPDHCDPHKYEADRQRDVQLQLAGYTVLRFTNRQIDRDLEMVLSQIEQILTMRRTGVDPNAPQ